MVSEYRGLSPSHHSHETYLPFAVSESKTERTVENNGMPLHSIPVRVFSAAICMAGLKIVRASLHHHRGVLKANSNTSRVFEKYSGSPSMTKKVVKVRVWVYELESTVLPECIHGRSR